ncbi:hypothetical protein FJT64_018360 [Amphibalanus amphitrite]|uniref:Uncharacterized protein n=1 Tax=Amphibalanus amphitrite TaxID=1232801 RepID=A0A6A4WV06_AMPAM|nr:hypothetical protein FJT64_018360 [Amphibalanus amphitrite]
MASAARLRLSLITAVSVIAVQHAGALPPPAADLAAADVLESIQQQVHTMQSQLMDLLTAIDTEPTSPEPTTQKVTTPEPTTPSLQRKRVSLRGAPVLTFRLARLLSEVSCESLQRDLNRTLDAADAALALVDAQQLDNATLGALSAGNERLNWTLECADTGRLVLSGGERDFLRQRIPAVETTAAAAADTIDGIVSPPTPAPADDSGFRSATIALGVLLSLTLVGAAVLAVLVTRRRAAAGQGLDNEGFN